MLTYTFLKEREAALPSLLTNDYYGTMAILSAKVDAVTGLDIFYSDGMAASYACYITLETTTSTQRGKRRFGVMSDGTNHCMYDYTDPALADSITMALKRLAIAATAAAAKIEPAAPPS